MWGSGLNRGYRGREGEMKMQHLKGVKEQKASFSP